VRHDPLPSVLIYAHPYPARSRAGRALLEAVADLPGLEVRSLYALYPDFDIDSRAEQAALERAGLVIWQAPFYWYGVPALLSAWFERVLAHGWAYGEGGVALRGKSALWVTTTGAPASEYQAGGIHGHPFDAFVPAIAQTARFCGMRWLDPPVVVHGAHRISAEALRATAGHYRRRLERLIRPGAPTEEESPDPTGLARSDDHARPASPVALATAPDGGRPHE
jgi:glutathione-regulated potassium-efflux system ancillary protein KefF